MATPALLAEQMGPATESKLPLSGTFFCSLSDPELVYSSTTLENNKELSATDSPSRCDG